jgi:hypothetical protein
MSLFARCPYCGHGKQVPDDAIGVSARCPKCRQSFVVVPENLPDEPTHTSSRFALTSAVDDDTPIAALPPPVEVRESPYVVPTPAVDVVSGIDWSKESAEVPRTELGVGVGVWVLAGIAAMAAIGAGVSAAITSLAFLVIPLAAAGVILGGVVLFLLFGRLGHWVEWAVPALVSGGSAVILLLALFAPGTLSPQYDVSQQKSTFDPEAIEVVPAGGELIDPQTLGSVGEGADASRAALQQGPVRVRVTGVTLGPLELDTAKPTTTKERYAIVGLQIQHVGHGGAVSFVAWGSAVPRSTPDVKLTRGGKAIGQVDLGAKAIRGKLYHEHALPPSGVLTTKVVFDPYTGPPEPLTLELPAEAWGKAGVFRFRIPASMVPAGPKK